MNDIFEITKQFTFEAAHYFPNMPEGHIYKKIHGHSFVVEVTFYGKKNKENQWVTDFDELSKVEKIKIQKLSFKNSNDDSVLKKGAVSQIYSFPEGFSSGYKTS